MKKLIENLSSIVGKKERKKELRDLLVDIKQCLLMITVVLGKICVNYSYEIEVQIQKIKSELEENRKKNSQSNDNYNDILQKLNGSEEGAKIKERQNSLLEDRIKDLEAQLRKMDNKILDREKKLEENLRKTEANVKENETRKRLFNGGVSCFF